MFFRLLINDNDVCDIQGGKVSRRPFRVTFRRLKETKRRPFGDQLLYKRRLFKILIDLADLSENFSITHQIFKYFDFIQ